MPATVAPAASEVARRPAARRPTLSARIGESLWTTLKIFASNPLSFAGFLIVVVMTVLGFAVWVAPAHVLPYPPSQQNFHNELATPSFAHPFGTDELGEDMFSRVLAALPLDLGIGLGIAGASLVIGGGLGLVSGFWDKPRTWGGLVSAVILRLADIFLAFPTLVLALAIFVAVGGGLNGAIIALLATWWPYYTRVVRGEVLALKTRPYIVAARAAGVSELTILRRHIFRNLLEPLAVFYTLDVGTVIVTFSTIAFVGINFPLKFLEWGNMVQYYSYLLLPDHPWPTIANGFMIFVTVLGFSLLGDGLRDVLDPRSRRVLSSVGEEAAPVRETAPVAVPALEGS